MGMHVHMHTYMQTRTDTHRHTHAHTVFLGQGRADEIYAAVMKVRNTRELYRAAMGKGLNSILPQKDTQAERTHTQTQTHTDTPRHRHRHRHRNRHRHRHRHRHRYTHTDTHRHTQTDTHSLFGARPSGRDIRRCDEGTKYAGAVQSRDGKRTEQHTATKGHAGSPC